MSTERARQLRDLGRWHEAAAAYSEVLAADPDDDDAQAGRAEMLAASGDHETALREFDVVLRRAPERTDVRYQRAVTYMVLRRDAEATADLDRLIADGVVEWYVWSDRGGLALRGGSPEAALADLEEAERRAPAEPSVQLNLGVALMAVGRPADAFGHLAVAADAGLPGAAAVREQVRRDLAARTSPSDVEAALDELAATRSYVDVVRLAGRRPALLAPAGLAAVEEAARGRGEPAPRLDDLRRLAAAVDGTEQAVLRPIQRERPLPTATPDEVDRHERDVARMLSLHGSGDRRQAADLAPAVAAAARDLYGPRSIHFGRRMLDVATTAAADGRWDVVLPVLDTAVDVLLEADPAELPDGLVNCAVLAGSAGPDEPSVDPVAVLELAATIVGRIPGAVGHGTFARVHREHAAVLRRTGRAERAEELLRDALDSPALTTAGAEASLASVTTALAEVLFALDRPREAVPLCERAVELARSAHGETHRTVALAMRGLGRVLRTAGDADSAVTWLSRAQRVWERLGPGETGELALTLGDLAIAYAGAGAAAQARDAVDRTLAVVPLVPGDGRIAEALHEIATMLRQLGDAETELTVRLRLLEVGGGRPEGPQLNALADVYFRLGRLDEAERWYTAALDAVLRDPAPDPLGIAALRHNLANVLGERGRDAEALVQHEQALEALSVIREPGHPDMLQFLLDTAEFALAEGRTDRARELLERARPHLGAVPRFRSRATALAGRLGAPPVEDVDPVALADAAAAALRDDQDDRAAQLFEQALAFAARTADPDHLLVATLKHNFAVVRVDTGRTVGTVELFRDALRIRESTLEPDDERLANTRLDLAQELNEQGAEAEAGELASAVLASRGIDGRPLTAGRAHTLAGIAAQNRGRVGEAEQHLDTALRLADDVGTPENRILARRNLVRLRLEQGRTDDAAGLADETLHLCAELVGPGGRLTSEARLLVATVARIRGRYAESEQQLRRVLADLDELGVEDGAFTRSAALMELSSSLHGQGRMREAERWSRRALASATGQPGESSVLVNRAVMAADAGDLDLALSTARQAVEGTAERHGTDDPRYGTALAVLGGIEARSGQVTAGIRHLTEAYEILAAAHGADHRSLMEPLTVLAQQYQQIGARRTARSFAGRAVALARHAHGPDHPAVAPPVLVLARSAAMDGDVDDALRLMKEAVALTPGSAANLIWLARLHAARGEPGEALDALRAAVALEDAELPVVLATAPEGFRRAHLARLWSTVEHVLTVALSGGLDADDLSREVWHLVVRRRGLNAEHLRRERRSASADGRPEVTRTVRDLADVRAELARAAYACDDGAAARLRTRRDELEQALAERTGAPDTSGLTFVPVVPPGTVYVEYVRTTEVDAANLVLGTPADATDPVRPRPRERYVAFVATAAPGGGTDVRMVDLGGADAIDELVDTYRGHVIAATHDDDGAALRERVLDPLLPAGDRSRLLVVADGALAGLPLQVLPTGDGRRVLDDRCVSYLSSARDLVDRPDTGAHHARGAPLVVADPDFDLGGSGATGGFRVSPLPGTRSEGAAVAALLGTPPHVGAEAATTLVQGARRPRIVHLATHGLFLPDPQPPPPGDVYASIEVLEVPGEGRFVVDATPVAGEAATVPGLPGAGSDPLLRSAVVLAGFNTWVGGGTPPPEAGNGVLSADEVCALDLQHTTLVVLSACETGLGSSRPTDGLVGLRWAFGVAGARCVVTSLWPVPDRETRDLMVEFYRRLLDGTAVAEALRAAQLALARARPHPFWWGAFVCHGDPGATLRPDP